jgi:hypothetical protein
MVNAPEFLRICQQRHISGLDPVSLERSMSSLEPGEGQPLEEVLHELLDSNRAGGEK